MTRPVVVAFDVIETLFSLEPLRARFVDAGLPGYGLEAWFTSLLRDAFALDATGIYRPFREVANSSLDAHFAKAGKNASREAVETILAGFTELDPHPDVVPAMEALHEEGVRIVTLTNGSAGTTGQLLERAGVAELVERAVSVDEVERWKPSSTVYRHCAKVAGVEPEALALVAAHGWDIHGANRAGLITGYVARGGAPFPAIMAAPDVSGSTLLEVVEGLLEEQ